MRRCSAPARPSAAALPALLAPQPRTRVLDSFLSCDHSWACPGGAVLFRVAWNATGGAECFPSHHAPPPSFSTCRGNPRNRQVGTLEAIKVKILIMGDIANPLTLRIELTSENDLFFQ